MNNPKTEEIVAALRCRAHGDDCAVDCICFSNKDFDCVSNFTVLTAAADLIEQLQQELIDERYRHDRLQDFCVAQGEELSKLKEQQRWIPVTERLPEANVPVLTLGPKGGVGIGYQCGGSHKINGEVWFYARHGNSLPTHWMPLPEPPKEAPHGTND